MTLPSGPRLRESSCAPRPFLYQSIAAAASSMIRWAVTVWKPSGTELFAFAITNLRERGRWLNGPHPERSFYHTPLLLSQSSHGGLHDPSPSARPDGRLRSRRWSDIDVSPTSGHRPCAVRASAADGPVTRGHDAVDRRRSRANGSVFE